MRLQHDSGPECVPTIVNPNFPGGNYIMFASATSGDRPNNHNFSLCSIGNMTLVWMVLLVIVQICTDTSGDGRMSRPVAAYRWTQSLQRGIRVGSHLALTDFRLEDPK